MQYLLLKAFCILYDSVKIRDLKKIVGSFRIMTFHFESGKKKNLYFHQVLNIFFNYLVGYNVSFPEVVPVSDKLDIRKENTGSWALWWTGKITPFI